MDSRVLTVLRQEYRLRVRTRLFLFTTLVLPIMMGALVALPGLFMSMKVGQPTSLAVVDQTGLLFRPLARSLADSSKTAKKAFTLVAEPDSGRTREQLARELGARVTADRIGGFILIPSNGLGGGECAFYAKNVSDFQRNLTIERALNTAAREVRIGQSKLDSSQVNAILKDVSFTTFKVGAGGQSHKDTGMTFGLAYAVGFVFYLSLIIYGIAMLRATLEEKTSRSAELMAATVRSSTLMTGKILGIGAVGLTQIGIWFIIVALFGAYSAASGFSPLGSPLSLSQIGITAPLAIFFVLYFLLGFLLYAALFGAIGAMVTSETEAQGLQTPIYMPIIIAFMLMALAIRDPNAVLIRVCSMIPLFAPILMMVRITVQMPPWWEIALSLVLLVAAIAGALWIAGRVFRVGILMYGKRPNLPELMKWIRYG